MTDRAKLDAFLSSSAVTVEACWADDHARIARWHAQHPGSTVPAWATKCETATSDPSGLCPRHKAAVLP